MRRRAAVVVALGACVGACVGAEREAPARAPAAAAPAAPIASDEPVPALLGCFVGDSAVYADVRTDPETGDTVGVWITFRRAGDGVDGVTVLNAAGRSDTIPFARLQLTDVDSIALDMPHVVDTDTSRFLGRVSCDRLWGRQRNRRDTPSRPALYRRIFGLDQPTPD